MKRKRATRSKVHNKRLIYNRNTANRKDTLYIIVRSYITKERIINDTITT